MSCQQFGADAELGRNRVNRGAHATYGAGLVAVQSDCIEQRARKQVSSEMPKEGQLRGGQDHLGAQGPV